MSKRHHEDDSESPTSTDNLTPPSQDFAKRHITTSEPSTKLVEPIVQCNLPPLCNAKPRDFCDLSLYEAHYRKYHQNICHECSANFPTPRFLDLHLQELHDPIFQANLARDKVGFRCFVEICDETFKSGTARRKHLEKEHDYPPAFRYNIVSRGLGKNTKSLLYPEKQTKPIPRASEARDHPAGNVAGIDAPNSPPQLNRKQRRALLGQGEDESGKTSHSEEPGHKVPKPAKTRNQVGGLDSDTRKAHADAVNQLLRSLDPETTETDSRDAPVEDQAMDELIDTFKASRIVPKSIKFGRGGNRY